MLHNILASTTCILAVWAAAVTAVPATPAQPSSPGPDQFLVSRLSNRFSLSASRTPFGFPQNVVLELLKTDSFQRPLVRYLCDTTVTSQEQWADRTVKKSSIPFEFRSVPSSHSRPKGRKHLDMLYPKAGLL